MNWHVFWSTFGLVFLAELGDKTQLAVIAQSAAQKSPWCVFLAGAAALVAASALGALAGAALSKFLSPRVVWAVGGVAFTVMGIWMLGAAIGKWGG